MPYATVFDLVSRFGARELIQITDRSEPPVDAIDETVAGKALEDAAGVIDGYIRVRYSLPIEQPPALLVDIACDLARYRLYADRATDEVRRRNDAAMSMLRDLGAGRAKLDIAGVEASAAPSQVLIDLPPRNFTRDTMGRF